nr:hypothetical protein [Angustibacter aerolatus]
MPDRGMDADVFVVSDMTIEVHSGPGGTFMGFNGTTEWALDSVDTDDVVWLPREDQPAQAARCGVRPAGDGRRRRGGHGRRRGRAARLRRPRRRVGLRPGAAGAAGAASGGPSRLTPWPRAERLRRRRRAPWSGATTAAARPAEAA